jgi:hypothetical protein
LITCLKFVVGKAYPRKKDRKRMNSDHDNSVESWAVANEKESCSFNPRENRICSICPTLSNLVFLICVRKRLYLKSSKWIIDCNDLLKDLVRGQGNLLDSMEEASGADARFRITLLTYFTNNLYQVKLFLSSIEINSP